MKSEFQETINRISRARQSSLLSDSMPGDVTHDAPDVVPEDGNVAGSHPTYRSGFDDTIVSRLSNVLESYRGDVSEWAESEPEPSWRDQFPSAMTMFLFALGVALVVGMNAVVLTAQSSAQQQAIANLGSAVVLMLAGISLFYDRTVRGIGNDQVRYESGRRVEAVSDQISSLAALYGQWLIEWKQRQMHLADLQGEIERERIAGEEAKSMSKTLSAECQDWLEKRIAFEEQADAQDRRLVQLRSEGEFAARKLAGLEQDIRTKSEQVASLRDQRNQLRDEILQLDLQRTEMLENEERLSTEHDALQRQRKRERDQLQLEIEERTAAVTVLRNDNQRLESEKNELVAELEMLRSEFDRNVEISTQQLTDLRRMIEDAQTEKGLVLEDIDRQQQVMRQLESNRLELVAAIEELSGMQSHKQEALESLIAKVGDRETQVTELEEQIAGLEQSRNERIATMRREITELDSDVASRRGDLSGLQSEIEQREQDRNQLVQELERISAIKSAMEFSVDGLAERLEQRASEVRKKTMQVNELAARLEALSNTVKGLSGTENTVRSNALESACTPGAIAPTSPRSAAATPTLDVDGPNGIEGPHFNKADIKRMMETLDKLDDLTQLGLS
jgi:chromosome segregation ATPase